MDAQQQQEQASATDALRRLREELGRLPSPTPQPAAESFILAGGARVSLAMRILRALEQLLAQPAPQDPAWREALAWAAEALCEEPRLLQGEAAVWVLGRITGFQHGRAMLAPLPALLWGGLEGLAAEASGLLAGACGALASLAVLATPQALQRFNFSAHASMLALQRSRREHGQEAGGRYSAGLAGAERMPVTRALAALLEALPLAAAVVAAALQRAGPGACWAWMERALEAYPAPQQAAAVPGESPSSSLLEDLAAVVIIEGADVDRMVDLLCGAADPLLRLAWQLLGCRSFLAANFAADQAALFVDLAAKLRPPVSGGPRALPLQTKQRLVQLAATAARVFWAALAACEAGQLQLCCPSPCATLPLLEIPLSIAACIFGNVLQPWHKRELSLCSKPDTRPRAEALQCCGLTSAEGYQLSFELIAGAWD